MLPTKRKPRRLQLLAHAVRRRCRGRHLAHRRPVVLHRSRRRRSPTAARPGRRARATPGRCRWRSATLARLRMMPASASSRSTSSSLEARPPRRCRSRRTPPGSRSRLCSIVRHDSPAWAPSRTRNSNSVRVVAPRHAPLGVVVRLPSALGCRRPTRTGRHRRRAHAGLYAHASISTTTPAGSARHADGGAGRAVVAEAGDVGLVEGGEVVHVGEEAQRLGDVGEAGALRGEVGGDVAHRLGGLGGHAVGQRAVDQAELAGHDEPVTGADDGGVRTERATCRRRSAPRATRALRRPARADGRRLTPRRRRRRRRTRRRNRSPADRRRRRSAPRPAACRRPQDAERADREVVRLAVGVDGDALRAHPAERHVGGTDAVRAQHDLVERLAAAHARPRTSVVGDLGPATAPSGGAPRRDRRVRSDDSRSAGSRPSRPPADRPTSAGRPRRPPPPEA